MVAPKDGLTSAPKSGFETGKHNTGLQSHVAFFDRDDDGVIWPIDTYVGFRDLKFGVFFSLLAMFIIHSAFSYVTAESYIPDPLFRLQIKNMHKAKHGSDTEAYTTTGEFDEKRFNSVFNMYSADPHTHLTFYEGVRMVHGNMNPFDVFGWFAAIFEWLTVYIMLWPDDPRGIKKEDVKGVYNGWIFYRISGRKPKY